MNSIPSYFVIMTGVSLHVLWHQQNHVAEVMNRRAALNPTLLILVNVSSIVSLLTLLGLSIYFGVKFGWFTVLKFIGLALFVQLLTTIVVTGLRLHKYAWAISLSGIILLPLFAGIMLYISFWR